MPKIQTKASQAMTINRRDRWIAQRLGGMPKGPDAKYVFPSWEVSVVRASYELGRLSYGWCCWDEKMLIASADGSGPVPRGLLTALDSLAREIAAELNGADRKRGRRPRAGGERWSLPAR
jgi:hypothetical protein